MFRHVHFSVNCLVSFLNYYFQYHSAFSLCSYVIAIHYRRRQHQSYKKTTHLVTPAQGWQPISKSGTHYICVYCVHILWKVLSEFTPDFFWLRIVRNCWCDTVIVVWYRNCWCDTAIERLCCFATRTTIYILSTVFGSFVLEECFIGRFLLAQFEIYYFDISWFIIH